MKISIKKLANNISIKILNFKVIFFSPLKRAGMGATAVNHNPLSKIQVPAIILKATSPGAVKKKKGLQA
jgi:hypothetical protein